MSVNKVILVGNVGNEIELKELDNKKSVCNFSLATSETFTNKNNEKVTQTEWHNIVAWNNNAIFASKYIKKGNLIYLEGSLRTRSWEDKEGNKKYTTEIYVDSLQNLTKKDS